MMHSWVMHKPGTWYTGGDKDPVLNKLEAGGVVPSIRTDVLLPLLVFVWSLVPETLQLRLRQNGKGRFCGITNWGYLRNPLHGPAIGSLGLK